MPDPPRSGNPDNPGTRERARASRSDYYPPADRRPAQSIAFEDDASPSGSEAAPSSGGDGPSLVDNGDGTFTVSSGQDDGNEGDGFRVRDNGDGTVTISDGQPAEGEGQPDLVPDPPAAVSPSQLQVERLGLHAGIAFQLATGTAPEDLDAAALVVGWDQYGPGNLGRWFVGGLGLQADGPSQPDEPVYRPLPAQAGGPMQVRSLRALILCTAQRTVAGAQLSPTLGDVATAVRSGVRCAQSHGVRSVALSLLGAGANGLPTPAAADAVVSTALVAVSGAPAGSFERVTFLARTSGEAALVRGAWSGFTPEGFANDAPTGRDLLGVSDELYALTEMLLLREVQPPFAVGILGGWGSGKSFAMDLMRRRITEIRSRTIDLDAGWGTSASQYVGHIYPIDFNAWTYARADLWAALMQTVLQGLDEQIGTERLLVDALDGPEWAQLDSVPWELRALYSLVPKADQAADESLFETLRQIYERDRVDLAAEEQALLDASVEQADRRAVIERQVEARLAEAAASKVREQAEAPIAAAMQISQAAAIRWLEHQVPELGPIDPGAERTLRDLSEARRQLRNLDLPRWRVAVAVLRRDWRSWAVATLVAAATVLLGVLGAQVLTVIPALVALAPALKAGRQVSVAFARQTAAIRSDLQREIDLIKASSERRVEESVEKDRRMRDVVAKADAAALRVDELRSRVGLVAAFSSSEELIEARLADSTYSERLGAMQQVSDDLRSLSSSLTVGEADLHRKEKQQLFPRGPARVVLFIDDLDRCPPAKVVEVLEAIQLRLSTGLFVVVVALDVRYVTRALEKTYEGVLDADGEPSGLDYLEKIIQIPYRARPGLGGAAATFIAAQLRVDAAAADGEVGSTAESPTPRDAAAAESEPEGVANPASSVEAAVARALTFTPADLEVVAEICRVLRLTPRSAKRVTNIVKLVRLVWARRGQYRPEVDDLATAALMVGLASAHPEWQRRAMRHLSGLGPDDEEFLEPLIEVLGAFQLAAAGEPMSPSRAAWQASIRTLGALRFRRDTEDGPTFAQLGGASVAQSMEIVDFVSAFCFVSDSDED